MKTSAVVIVALGCVHNPVQVCVDAVMPAVAVTVQDSATHAPIALELVGGILRDGKYMDQMQRRGSMLVGGDDRPGNYEVEIRAVGYQVWTRSGILVEPGVACPINESLHLSARLQRERRTK